MVSTDVRVDHTQIGATILVRLYASLCQLQESYEADEKMGKTLHRKVAFHSTL